jgi:hypothetical protein
VPFVTAADALLAAAAQELVATLEQQGIQHNLQLDLEQPSPDRDPELQQLGIKRKAAKKPEIKQDLRLDLQQPSPELALGLQQLGAVKGKAREAKQQQLLPLCEREMKAQLLAELNSPQVRCY